MFQGGGEKNVPSNQLIFKLLDSKIVLKAKGRRGKKARTAFRVGGGQNEKLWGRESATSLEGR